MNAREHYLADHARVAARLPGAGVPWLERLRAAGLDTFAQRGFPTRHDEEWKYTSVAALEQHAFHAMADRNAADAAPLAARLALFRDDGHLLVFHDGRYAPALSSPGRLPAGARLASLAGMLNEAPQMLEPCFAQASQQSTFDALNTAFMSDGAYLHLKRGTVLEAPVHLLFLSSTAGAASYVRNVVVAEEGAQATVIEHYAGIDGAPYFTNAVTRIFAAANAAVSHHKLQQEASCAFHIASLHASQQRDSRLESHSFSLGAALARHDIGTEFDAPGCEALFNGLYLAGAQQHVDHHTRIDHRQPNGTSRELYRGVLADQAHAVFNGKVIVRPGAQKTDAFQANHNLLLSREAEIDTKPELEIYADDVKCNHGATIGQLDEAQLFYLRSRGIGERVARSLLVQAFAHDVIERIRVAALRTRLEQLLPALLPQDEHIGGL